MKRSFITTKKSIKIDSFWYFKNESLRREHVFRRPWFWQFKCVRPSQALNDWLIGNWLQFNWTYTLSIGRVYSSFIVESIVIISVCGRTLNNLPTFHRVFWMNMYCVGLIQRPWLSIIIIHICSTVFMKNYTNPFMNTIFSASMLQSNGSWYYVMRKNHVSRLNSVRFVFPEGAMLMVLFNVLCHGWSNWAL